MLGGQERSPVRKASAMPGSGKEPDHIGCSLTLHLCKRSLGHMAATFTIAPRLPFYGTENKENLMIK